MRLVERRLTISIGSSSSCDSMYQASGPHGPVSSSWSPRRRTTNTSAWTGPSVPTAVSSGFWSRPREHVLPRDLHVVGFASCVCTDRHQLFTVPRMRSRMRTAPPGRLLPLLAHPGIAPCRNCTNRLKPQHEQRQTEDHDRVLRPLRLPTQAVSLAEELLDRWAPVLSGLELKTGSRGVSRSTSTVRKSSARLVSIGSRQGRDREGLEPRLGSPPEWRPSHNK